MLVLDEYVRSIMLKDCWIALDCSSDVWCSHTDSALNLTIDGTHPNST